MKFNKFNTTVFLAAFLVIVDLLVGLNINAFYIRAVLAFLFITIVPGLLIMLIMKIREVGFWEYLVYTIGLSISLIMFAGLAVNWILPWLNITDKPLSLWPILISFNIFLIIMGYFAYKRNQDLEFEPNFPKLDLINNIFFIIPMFFPVMAILGAFILNNDGPNTITMIMLGGIAVYVFALVLFRNRLNENVYPWALWLIGLSLLLMGWMRSWYVSGVDISLEYNIFQTTNKIALWDIDNIKNAYNSLLSVTILPNILDLLLNINRHMLLKLIFPIIFSLISIIIYLISKKIFKPSLAFCSAAFFIFQPTFITWTWIPLRQELSFLFFSLALLELINGKSNLIKSKSLILLFSFSFIVSHYSTSYIGICLLIIFFSFFSLIKIIKKKIKISEKNNISNKLNLSILITIFLFGFIWYSQITPNSEGLTDFIKKSFININSIFKEDIQAEGQSFIDQINVFNKKISYNEKLKEYNNNIINQTLNKDKTNYYDLSSESNTLSIRSIPGKESALESKYIKIINLTWEFLKLAIKILPFIGIFYLVMLLKNKKIDGDYLIINVSTLILLIGILLLPFSSIVYDQARTYQQALTILAVPTILGLVYISKLLGRKEINQIIIVTFITIYFLFSSGFINQLIGGTNISLRLNNEGFEYSQLYFHKSELLSSNWLFINSKVKIYNMDDISRIRNRISENYEYEGDFSLNMIPIAIKKNSYVYLSNTNINNKIAFKYYDGIVLTFSLQYNFINKNKNKIYNNKESEIFK